MLAAREDGSITNVGYFRRSSVSSGAGVGAVVVCVPLRTERVAGCLVLIAGVVGLLSGGSSFRRHETSPFVLLYGSCLLLSLLLGAVHTRRRYV